MSSCFSARDEIARKTEQLEEKSAALGVGGIVAYFSVQSLNGVVEAACLKNCWTDMTPLDQSGPPEEEDETSGTASGGASAYTETESPARRRASRHLQLLVGLQITGGHGVGSRRAVGVLRRIVIVNLGEVEVNTSMGRVSL